VVANLLGHSSVEMFRKRFASLTNEKYLRFIRSLLALCFNMVRYSYLKLLFKGG
jgi:hypothetical protein